MERESVSLVTSPSLPSFPWQRAELARTKGHLRKEICEKLKYSMCGGRRRKRGEKFVAPHLTQIPGKERNWTDRDYEEGRRGVHSVFRAICNFGVRRSKTILEQGKFVTMECLSVPRPRPQKRISRAAPRLHASLPPRSRIAIENQNTILLPGPATAPPQVPITEAFSRTCHNGCAMQATVNRKRVEQRVAGLLPPSSFSRCFVRSCYASSALIDFL